MRYMLLIYTREEIMAHAQGFSGGRALQWLCLPHYSFGLRLTHGGNMSIHDLLHLVVIDGPFAETKEQLAGYYILDCKDMDEALAWAEKIPTGCGGKHGCIEVRPLREMPANVMAQQPEYSTIECNG